MRGVGGGRWRVNFGPRGPVYMAPRKKYLPVQLSTGVQRVEKRQCDSGNWRGSLGVCVCKCALAYNSGLLYPEEKNGHGDRGRNKEAVLQRQLSARCSTQKHRLVIAVLSVNPIASQCASGFSEPLRPNVGNGRSKKTSLDKMWGLSAVSHANICPMPGTQSVFNIDIYYPLQYHRHVWLLVLKIIIIRDIHVHYNNKIMINDSECLLHSCHSHVHHLN